MRVNEHLKSGSIGGHLESSYYLSSVFNKKMRMEHSKYPDDKNWALFPSVLSDSSVDLSSCSGCFLPEISFFLKRNKKREGLF